MKDEMIVNKETAMRLWTSRYGKKTKAVDFAGRTMAKSAYDDRNSEFGWNLDHIYPQSKGGKTADHNLICCHILTNDEKADKICFNANGQLFKVIKVENHYEIVNQSSEEQPSQPTLFDSAYGIRLFNKLKKDSKKQKFCGEILIDLRLVQTSAIFDFIREIFNSENVNIFSKGRNYLSFTPNAVESHLVVIRSYDVGLKSLIQDLLDKCILLNTYLSNYLVPTDNLRAYDIYFDVVYSETADKYYQNVNIGDMNSYSGEPTNKLYIDELVIENTSAKSDLKNEKQKESPYSGISANSKWFGGKNYLPYNYVFTKLADNLKKEVSRQG